MEKEQLLKSIVEATEKVHTSFRWENLFKLSKKELAFIGGMIGKLVVYEKSLVSLLGKDSRKLKTLTEKIIAEEGMNVIDGVL